MKHAKRVFAGLLVVLFLQNVEEARACDGTLNPPCGRSIFLAKFAPSTVVLTSGPINLPVGLLPFVTWDNVNTNLCAQPVSATLTLTLNCTPVGGGSPIAIGPINIPVPTPTMPGAQTNIGSPVTVTIPAGTISQPSVCLVQGTYTVNFSGGGGSGQISGSGDTEICIVEPSPLNDTIPRLDLQAIGIPPDPGFPVCRPGDQATLYYIISNNDPDHAVSLTFDSRMRQAAGLPDGISAEDAADMGVFAISSPVPGTDAFAQAFGNDESQTFPLSFPAPEEVSDRMITSNFTIPPLNATIVTINSRSFGACADGSCNEQIIRLEGQYANGDPALTCGGTLLLVDSTIPGKTPQCEYGDILQVGPNTDAIWGVGSFLNQNVQQTHTVTHNLGNSEDLFGFQGRGTLTRGENFNEPLTPPSASDIVRSDSENFGSVSYNVLFFAQIADFRPLFNNVNIAGLHTEGAPQEIIMPLIGIDDGKSSQQVLDINLDLKSETLQIFFDNNQEFNGNVNEFFGDPPAPFFTEIPTVRQFFKTDDRNRKLIRSDPGVLVFISPTILMNDSALPFLTQTQSDTSDTLLVMDQNGTPISWSAAVRGDGISLRSSSGTGELIIDYVTGGLPLVPQTPLAFIDITSADAINAPLTVPVALRVDTTNVTSVAGDDIPLPSTTRLVGNYPNPFNPTTTIAFELRASERVFLRVFNVRGQLVRTLTAGQLSAGQHTAVWDGRNDRGEQLPSGLYISQLQAGDLIDEAKMLLVK